ncbi:MAG: hypothetical protein JRH20_08965 [Deltaproteobacteria bacterium]|nr:hypothetical protein [Deltaproteobacteria bacterium]
MKTLTLLFCAILLIGCGGQNDNEDPCDIELTCSDADSLCAILKLPEDFDAVPAKVYVVGFAEWPPTGMPDAFLYTGSSAPDFGDCGQLPLKLENLTASGELYVAFELLVEGGGSMTPTPNVDYVYVPEETLAFDGSPINLGEVVLRLHQET